MRDKHGKYKSPEYQAWGNMVSRCTNPNMPNYKFYGGRGIAVSKEWKRFIHFYRDMGDRPSSKHTLERRDNNKGYSKENCYWATTKQQSLNRRSNKVVSYNGQSLSLREWADLLNINYVTLVSRFRRGDTAESALDGRLHAGFKR